MANKIIFYIRALFHESIMPGSEKSNKPDKLKLVEAFNKYSGITVQEYRKQVHEIQLKCIKNISDRIIYNRAQENLNRKFNYSYCILQKDTLEILKSINEDDLVIPLDDDDWLSPEIKNLNFVEGSFNGWNTISFCHSNPSNIRIFHHVKNIPLPYKLESDLEIKQSQGWLSNCQCIPGFVIKRLLEESQIDILQQLLQRHSRVRRLIREEPMINWNLKEHFFDDVLAIYVRHAANITLLDSLSIFNEENNYTKEVYDKTVRQFKLADYDNIKDLPENLKWCLPYLQDLKQLNNLL